MNIHEIHDLSNKYVVNILKTGLSEVCLNPDNYSPDMAHCNSNLFFILENGRYTDSTYYVIEEDGKYIGSAGWNKYDDSTALLLTRAYITPKYRAKYLMGNLLVPQMLAATLNFEKVWLTFNEYNNTIYNWFLRNDAGLRPALFNNWPDIYKQFVPIGKHIVYNTKQYVVQLIR